MSEHEHRDESGAHGDTHHGIRIEAAEPDRASYPWLMTVITVFLAFHLVGLVVLWLYFQRNSEGTVHAQVLTVSNPDLLQLRAREQAELASYGVANREEGLYRVPVDRGIGLYLEMVRSKTTGGEPIRIGAPVPVAGMAAPSGEGASSPAPAPAGRR